MTQTAMGTHRGRKSFFKRVQPRSQRVSLDATVPDAGCDSTDYQQGCSGKVEHHSEAAAIAYLQTLGRTRFLAPYACRVCGCWHTAATHADRPLIHRHRRVS